MIMIKGKHVVRCDRHHLLVEIPRSRRDCLEPDIVAQGAAVSGSRQSLSDEGTE